METIPLIAQAKNTWKVTLISFFSNIPHLISKFFRSTNIQKPTISHPLLMSHPGLSYHHLIIANNLTLTPYSLQTFLNKRIPRAEVRSWNSFVQICLSSSYLSLRHYRIQSLSFSLFSLSLTSLRLHRPP